MFPSKLSLIFRSGRGLKLAAMGWYFQRNSAAPVVSPANGRDRPPAKTFGSWRIGERGRMSKFGLKSSERSTCLQQWRSQGGGLKSETTGDRNVCFPKTLKSLYFQAQYFYPNLSTFFTEFLHPPNYTVIIPTHLVSTTGPPPSPPPHKNSWLRHCLSLVTLRIQRLKIR